MAFLLKKLTCLETINFYNILVKIYLKGSKLSADRVLLLYNYKNQCCSNVWIPEIKQKVQYKSRYAALMFLEMSSFPCWD
jgi:hypothetical protein